MHAIWPTDPTTGKHPTGNLAKKAWVSILEAGLEQYKGLKNKEQGSIRNDYSNAS